MAQDPILALYRPHWSQQANGLHHSISFSGEYNAGSDAITNSFLNSFYKGIFIAATSKTEQENRLLPSNRIGIYATYAGSYCWRPNADSSNWEFVIAYRDRQTLFGKFSSDAFKLAFEGNRPFLGKTATLDNTNLTNLHWQQIQFEAKYYTPDRKTDAVIGFSILNGQQLQEINIRRASLFTEQNGTALNVSSSATYYRSDTAFTKTGSRNGSGTSFNFRFNTKMGDTTSPYRQLLTFIVQDIGFIRWNKNSEIYSVDTSLHFTGVDASAILINSGQLAGIPNSDSLIGAAQNGQIISFLPLGVLLRYTLFTPGQFWGGIDARAWSYCDALPQISMFAGWHTKNCHFSLTTGAAWGGYSRLQFPLKIVWEPCSRFSLLAGTNNAIGYLVPSKTRGQGLFVNLSYAF